MWIFTRFGFFSIVAHADRPAMLCVRARARSDLELLVNKLAVDTEILTTPRADYGWRIVVPRAAMVGILCGELCELDYVNFKNEVAHTQSYHRAHLYERIWSVMLELQRTITGR